MRTLIILIIGMSLILAPISSTYASTGKINRPPPLAVFNLIDKVAFIYLAFHGFSFNSFSK